MNKEERAENWFRNIPGEEKIPMEKKMELCGRVTIPIIVICLGIFIAEYALLRFFGGGTLIDRAADFVNEMARAKGRVHYTTIALAGVIMMFPFAILPVTASTLYRRSWLSKQAEKILADLPKQNGTEQGKRKEENARQSPVNLGSISWRVEADGTVLNGFREDKLTEALQKMQRGEMEFLIFTPNRALPVEESTDCCDFLQLCEDENPEYLHFELSLVNPAVWEGRVIYGKDRVSVTEAEELLLRVFARQSVPSIDSFEPVLNLRK